MASVQEPITPITKSLTHKGKDAKYKKKFVPCGSMYNPIIKPEKVRTVVMRSNSPMRALEFIFSTSYINVV